jgi:hypothetical protein
MFVCHFNPLSSGVGIGWLNGDCEPSASQIQMTTLPHAGIVEAAPIGVEFLEPDVTTLKDF